jgi:hypothetical protein
MFRINRIDSQWSRPVFVMSNGDTPNIGPAVELLNVSTLAC